MKILDNYGVQSILNSSQSTMEFQKLWRRFCRLSKNDWRQRLRREPYKSEPCLLCVRVALQFKREPWVLHFNSNASLWALHFNTSVSLWVSHLKQ